MLVLLAVIGVSVVAASAVILERLVISGTRTENNAEIIRAIQDERARTILENCRIQNDRHRRLVKVFDPLVASRSDTTQAEAREFAIPLADAIAPVRDCRKVVARAVVRERED
jgi:hypothetical protein